MAVGGGGMCRQAVSIGLEWGINLLGASCANCTPREIIPFRFGEVLLPICDRWDRLSGEVEDSYPSFASGNGLEEYR